MADYEGSGKIFLDMLVGQLNDNHAKIIKAFEDVHDDMAGVYKLAKKNQKKIRGLKLGVFGLGVTVAILASELAERKRCENWLKDENDELKTRVEELENDVGKLKIDGGAADA